MTSLAGWTPPPFPPAKVLEGRYARLEPLNPERHTSDIAAAMAGAHAVWTYLPWPPPKDAGDYAQFLHAVTKRPATLPFAVIDRADDKAKGHLCLMEIRPEHGVFEVGAITYSPAVQRTRVATEAIYLCGRYGFDLGYRRYEWKCNNRNEPSKRAAVRFGFIHEGVFRQHMVVKGENRDTAWFAITDGEWPRNKAAFEAWLDPSNFDAQGRQRKPLAAFRELQEAVR